MSLQSIAIIGEKSRTNELRTKFERNDRIQQIALLSYEDRSLYDLKSFDLVIDTYEGEHIIERLKSIESNLLPQTILAAFSVYRSTSEILQHLNNPSRFIGLHFFRLAHQTDLVEIIQPEIDTNNEFPTIVSTFLEKAQFVPVTVKDRPGLLANRLLIPYLNQAAQVFDDNIATGIDIDNSVKLGLGYPIGPLQLLDDIGIDQYISSAQAIYHEIPETKYTVPPILNRMQEVRLHGRKTGRGFYQYKENKQYEPQK
ncbi:3-hydroxyacyl-CoA dehydrogenase family protein [Neobacillus sp. YX16]|uniref:3-hydroxyacyl-CoA dehydrogenase family protein n=1 Tax=Neobacillus sp. YX16 TaxID=3047874 RepID=UPI0024C38212|nr:3-hydroxyacyl-CoA dehydrogenase family protein [Neobacillus sp. YX16]WHZ00889.1 3-hydroxyacyl-CoA dehydrogenase family protein [Neobacillus sp. YX16]